MKKLKQVLFILILIITTNNIYAQINWSNDISMGVALRQNVNIGQTSFSLAVGYERYIAAMPTITIEPILEAVFSKENTSGIFGVSVGFYPVDVLKLWFAPCFSYMGGEKHIVAAKENSPEYFELSNNFLFKFGVGYHIRMPNQHYSIMPFLEGNVITSQFILAVGAKLRYHF